MTRYSVAKFLLDRAIRWTPQHETWAICTMVEVLTLLRERHKQVKRGER